MIPKPKTLLYDWASMKKGEFIKARNYPHAMSIYNSGTKRGYKLAQRTVDNEIRVYLVGKKPL